ncbi:MAG: SMP-30/gluconolactonase/LRE family protein [Bryobacteraceae bacterium]
MPGSVALAQNLDHIEVQRLAKDLHYADGPVWSWDGYMLYSDVPVDRLRKFVPGTGDVEVGPASGGSSGQTYDKDGRLYRCEFRQRRVTRTGKGGTEVLAAKFEGKRFNAPNDIVVRRDGHVYFTDPAFGSQQDEREMDYYGIFHVTPKGELEAVAKWKTRPNGITLSPNGRTLYVSDSDARLVRAYDLDGKGTAANERVVVEKIAGVPDGLRTDERGNLYVAARSVFIYANPAERGGGKFLGEVDLAERPTNLAFGDPDMETLYITTRTGVFRTRLGVKGALQY